MHESALSKQILCAVLERAQVEGGKRVRAVSGFIAETERLDRAALQFHFAAHAKETPAEGALLSLELIEVRARCAGCGNQYLPDHHVLLCPDCGSTEAQLLGRTGLWIDSIEVET